MATLEGRREGYGQTQRNEYHKSDNLLEAEWPSSVISSSPACFVLEDVNKVDSSDLAWFLMLLWSASASVS